MSSDSNPAIHSVLQQEAISWLLRLRSDDISDDELCGFADWIASDISHSEAFAAAEQLFDEMTLAIEQTETSTEQLTPTDKSHVTNFSNQNKQELPDKPARKYFRWATSAIAIAAAWLLAINLIIPQQFHWLDNFRSDHYTQTGEIREIMLSDGSQLLLNTNSAVSVDFNPSLRRITLLHGQVRFTVAPDPARPFEVASGQLVTIALGTIFEIYYRDPNDIRITAQEHSVVTHVLPATNSSISHAQNHVIIPAGQQLVVSPDNNLLNTQAVELNETSAWQQQRLLINDQPLLELIEELQRYRTGRIFVADEDLKQLRISGVFHLDKPDEVINSVCKVLGLKKTQIGPWWVLLHR